MSRAIRVVLPTHLRALAHVGSEIDVHAHARLVGNANSDAGKAVTLRDVLDAIEAEYPMLRGTIRDHVTQKRRAFVRFYACERDLSHDSPDNALPERVRSGDEPLLVVGAMAGG